MFRIWWCPKGPPPLLEEKGRGECGRSHVKRGLRGQRELMLNIKWINKSMKNKMIIKSENFNGWKNYNKSEKKRKQLYILVVNNLLQTTPFSNWWCCVKAQSSHWIHIHTMTLAPKLQTVITKERTERLWKPEESVVRQYLLEIQKQHP